MHELNFDDGIEEAIEFIEGQPIKPCLVAVYGQQNSGKTKLIETLVRHFRNNGLRVVDSEGYLPPKSADEIKGPEFDCDLFFFHFGWEKPLTGCMTHLDIGIYNPNMHERPVHKYGLLISNSGSHDKYIKNI